MKMTETAVRVRPCKTKTKRKIGVRNWAKI